MDPVSESSEELLQKEDSNYPDSAPEEILAAKQTRFPLPVKGTGIGQMHRIMRCITELE
ncbi:MAG: hypothetical protein HDQ96_03075 [Lachnospiraceae bacterium]|nr:hypothetical protein [Lachnospiraceae bacterium]